MGEWVNAGTNLQNLSKGIQRQQIIPDIGEEFCHVDLWAAEAFLVALDAQEPFLIDMLYKGIKPYNWLSEELEKKFPEHVIKYDYSYKDSKQSIHLFNYGGHASKAAKESGLPLFMAEWMYNFYHGTCPGIKRRMKEIEEAVTNTRTLVSPLGRRRFFLAPLSDKLLQQAYAWKSQSCIGEITNIALGKLYWKGRVGDTTPGLTWLFPAMNTHDGMAIRCRLGEREVVKKMVMDAFNIPLEVKGLKIKIPVEIGWGKNFNDVKNKEICFYE